MREILFRGKASGFGVWIYGMPKIVYDKKDGIVDFIETESESGEYIDIDTLGQYTGLKDINGNKIFEGDIVNVGAYKNQVVCWDQEVCGFNAGECTMRDYLEFEIIGNIHDNPELSKKDGE